ncbi:MAG: HD domain-containing protein [Candidatus Omnitrophica bacterium]|nr:HD domain-containing protein [Candidatus Omnitrophota bacterium]
MLDFSNLYNSQNNEKDNLKDAKTDKPLDNLPQEPVKSPGEFSSSGNQASQGISFSEINFSQEDTTFNENVFQNSRQFYLECLAMAEDAINNLQKAKGVDFQAIHKKILELTENISFGDKYFLVLMNEVKNNNFLAVESVNVAILALEIGIQLGFNKSKLEKLALAGFFHDMGLGKMINLVNSTRSLTFNEVNQIKGHPRVIMDLLNNEAGISEEVINGILHHHEKLDGSGYPNGLKKGQISEFGQIISVADIFESLTHPRPYRNQVNFLEAFKTIFQSKQERINPKYVDALIRGVGFYPLGSWVKLDDGHIGKVVFVDKKFPLRPVILILFYSTGKTLDVPKRIDLRRHAQSNIVTIISSDEVNSLAVIKKELAN